MPSALAAQAFMSRADCPRPTTAPRRLAEAASPTISAVRLVENFSMSRRMVDKGALACVTSAVPPGRLAMGFGAPVLIPCERAKVAKTSPA